MVQSPEDLAACPQLASRGFYVDIDHPKTGPVAYPGPLCRMTQTPWQVKCPAPMLGQHNEEVYGGLLGYGEKRFGGIKK